MFSVKDIRRVIYEQCEDCSLLVLAMCNSQLEREIRPILKQRNRAKKSKYFEGKGEFNRSFGEIGLLTHLCLIYENAFQGTVVAKDVYSSGCEDEGTGK